MPDPAPVITATLPSSLIPGLPTYRRYRVSSPSRAPITFVSARLEAGTSSARRPAPVPLEATQDDTATTKDHALLLEPDPLRHHARHSGPAADAAPSIADTVPRHGPVRDVARLPHRARRPRPSHERRHVAAGRGARPGEPRPPRH